MQRTEGSTRYVEPTAALGPRPGVTALPKRKTEEVPKEREKGERFCTLKLPLPQFKRPIFTENKFKGEFLMYIMVSGGRQERCRQYMELCKAKVGLLKSVCSALINWCVFYFLYDTISGYIDNILPLFFNTPIILFPITWKQTLFSSGQRTKSQDDPQRVKEDVPQTLPDLKRGHKV